MIAVSNRFDRQPVVNGVQTENRRSLRVAVLITCLVFSWMPPDREKTPPVPSALDVLRTMWIDRRIEVQADAHSLVRTLEALEETPFAEDIESSVRHLAHQLAGIFGIFGFADLKAKMLGIEQGLSDRAVPVRALLDIAREALSSLP
jgi:hypothetical protein